MVLLLAACTQTSALPDDDPADPVDTADTSDTDPSPAPVPVGLWVWDGDIPGDATATADLLAFSSAHSVTTLFLTCDPVGYGAEGAVERFRTFIEAAHAAELEVYGVSGYSWFSVPCDAGLVGQDTCWTEGWAVYEACVAADVGFDGIMDDTEPASSPDGSFFTDYAQRAAWHLTYLRGIRERIGDLPLHHAIPAWYDTLEPLSLDDGDTVATLDIWIAGIVDVLGVMSYRDTAAAVTEQAATELSRGPVWIGLETGPSAEGEDLTFADDGAGAVTAAIDELSASSGADANLRGVMVDSYETWRELP